MERTCKVFLLVQISLFLLCQVSSNEEISRSQFPKGFFFGAATSSYQVEGAVFEDGKGLNNWDIFSHTQGLLLQNFTGDVLDGKNADVADDHYHRYEVWCSCRDDFAYYADICFRNFGDRVKYWLTINEPNIFSTNAYKDGIYPPRRCSPPFGNCSLGDSDTEPLIVVHNMILSHAKATNIYRKYYQAKQGGYITIVPQASMLIPISNAEVDRGAANRAMAFSAPWILDPLLHGEYPSEMRQYLGDKLPTFSPEEVNIVKGSVDFIGFTHYSTLYAKDCIQSVCDSASSHAIQGYVYITGERNGTFIGEATAFPSFFVVPEGLEMLVEYLKTRYNNTPMFVLEHGMAQADEPIELHSELLHDEKRVNYHKSYLASLERAIRNGADVRGNVLDGGNADVADDHYHRIEEDIEVMHSLGINSYRFSISWTRILPRGRFGNVNTNGIKFYNKLIDSLLLKGIEPFVTITHHEIPQELEDRYQSWLSPLIQDDFAYYADVCFRNFGDRVKYWVTINEPNLFSSWAYMEGFYPPGRCSSPFGNCSSGDSDRETLIVVHNMILSHAKASNLYRNHYQAKQGGYITIVPNAKMLIPVSDSEADREAANRAMAFSAPWILDPIVHGDYPPEMRQYLGDRLPKFSPDEVDIVKGSIDFIGFNHYATLYAKDCIQSCSDSSSGRAIQGFVYTTGERNGTFIGEPTASPLFFLVPEGLEMLVGYIKTRYNNKYVLVGEWRVKCKEIYGHTTI
ncbi:Beta-glucosidase [Thalictrum thalictroides]|uniref:Beta-glucosidase n=1 Tax=Thalictrum thalictroides TaxID=46969 RepID=A0A7J6UZ42_THATH|nr:Beta-glucosidase [Thalictrum thalictroides]